MGRRESRWVGLRFALRVAAVSLLGAWGAVVRAALERRRARPEVSSSPLAPRTARTEQAEHFVAVSEPGFGDRWNTYAWSMQWWNDKLYVGTARAFVCLEYFAIHRAFPRVQRYPPRVDPDVRCPASPYDLPLQGEIWCFEPSAERWSRVYQSPADVAAPGCRRFIARHTGFRGMLVFTEPGGGQALYASGFSARTIDPRLPPPRVVRSVDGVRFEPVPADPGTTLGDLDAVGFRGLTAFHGRLFVVAGNLYGDGILLEAADPATGNDAYRVVSPPGMRVYETAVFDDFLYVGVRDPVRGYAVVKTDAEGSPPYSFATVVSGGGGRRLLRSHSVLSMHCFGDALFVGTEFPAELLRIHPDDSWDLVAGGARWTGAGRKRPLSGRGDGLGYAENISFDRLQAHDGRLYVGTSDCAKMLRTRPRLGPLLEPYRGCDLFVTPDGVRYDAVTHDGFGDPANGRVRTLASTPWGLFVGTANALRGGRVYLGARSAPREIRP